ncbi:uncharacterized protein LOC116359750 isoform X4 [Oncorhynchus kisutch]|uniref:uncharacterized protein LOC116359750 isoform X4 n=1 Tax=Oncorhynchus kisutch TaxID=8019 RepID=UPI0012DCE66B|nr:uncharacterized protein LOC116359750 isoform X4 [Oncorhynchus kisutch]
MDFIEQNKHLLWNWDSWECIPIKIIKGAQVQQATDNSLFYLGMITGVAACVAVLVFGGVIMRKIHLRTQLQVSGNVKEEEQRDIEPYSTFTRKTNGLYSTLQLLNP